PLQRKLTPNSYKNIQLKNCCMDGVYCYLQEKDCSAGINRVKKLRKQQCVSAFSECCSYARQVKEKADEPIKDMTLGRMCRFLILIWTFTVCELYLNVTY
uniref:Anaphylatoxin-like domain-containing protein n=1 Tax=Leptobrachium leishanense TaxID=445787 RepID=A0A8C5RAG2_9ANUR